MRAELGQFPGFPEIFFHFVLTQRAQLAIGFLFRGRAKDASPRKKIRRTAC
jgi:hypothetical protein